MAPRRYSVPRRARLRSRGLFALGVVLVAAGIGVLSFGEAFAGPSAQQGSLSPVLPSAGSSSPESGGASPDTAGIDPSLGPSALSVSASQQSSALAIASSYPAVKTLLAGRATTQQALPWTNIDGTSVIGVAVTYSWTAPQSVSATWPVMLYDQTEKLSPPYATTTAKIVASNVKGVQVWVDLKKSAVVGMDVDGNATTTQFSVNPSFVDPRPAQPAGSGE
jgi:hypothetical protein